MAQSYKLRLGDGTVLTVDRDGLRTWAVDEKAMVQPAGSRGWRSLKEFLAQDGRASYEDDPLAIIPLKPLDDGPRRGALRPPPSTDELTTLRLAEVDDDEPMDEDIYEGPSVIGAWAVRGLLVAGFVGSAIVAFATWESWWPRTEQFGNKLCLEIDRRTRPPRPVTLSPGEQESVDRREALQAAIGELSYLSPQTIESVMSTSSIGILDPPEVFRRAYDAAERGLPSLSKTEAQELKALQSTMLAALEPSERARVQRYDLARARLVTLPFEDREMLGMFVRRASALEASARARLQVLSGKAIAAGLAITAETTTASR